MGLIINHIGRVRGWQINIRTFQLGSNNMTYFSNIHYCILWQLLAQNIVKIK
jgi:hypothetical protein